MVAKSVPLFPELVGSRNSGQFLGGPDAPERLDSGLWPHCSGLQGVSLLP